MSVERINAIKDLTIQAAKEVVEKAPDQFPHLERLLKYMEDEVARHYEAVSAAMQIQIEVDREWREMQRQTHK